jgi:hypothetical protein
VGTVNSRHIKRILRWYPATWRRRYGEELVAMLDDTYGDDKLPPRVRASLVRSGITERVRRWRRISNTYTGYSIGCAVVWTVILSAVWTHTEQPTRHTIAVFFGGWAIGWLSASIARIVYPPPKPRKPVGTSP